MSEQPSQPLVSEAFLSHCSAQRDFVLYLGARLKAHALRYFSSSESEQGCEAGRPFDESLLQRVRGAKAVVLVLSQQFFGSKWCLRELAEALQQRDLQPEKVLLPVFYGWQRPEGLREWLLQPEQQPLHASWLKWQRAWQQQPGQQQLTTSQDLLQLVDSITHMHGVVFPPGSSNPQLADQVLSKVLPHIHCQAFPEEQFVGAVAWVDWAISHLLQQKGLLGVWGMGGRGKTTLARALFNQLYEQFDGRAAYVEVGQQPSRKHLLEQQRHILESVCGADARISAPSQGEVALQRSLLAAPRHLIILDDLWEDPAQPNMLQWLLPRAVARACSSKGSWVVVTTRDSSIVTRLLGSGTAQEVPVLGEDEEWGVLQLNAGSQLEGWPAADRQLLLQAGRHLPLKLQLLGRQLNAAGPEGYQDVLQRVRDCGNPAEVTQGLDAAFITSYRALPSPSLQLAFLDIALFMQDEPKQHVADWCDAIHGRKADDVVRILERRALVTVTSRRPWHAGLQDCVGMHDELRDFVLRYVDPLTAVPGRRLEAVACFWEKQQQALQWAPGSSSRAPQQLVVVKCQDPAVLLSSLPGNPGHPVPSQPRMDSLEVLVMRHNHELSVRELRLHCLHNLTFVDIRGMALTQLQLGELPSLKVLLMSSARLYEWRDWGERLSALQQLQFVHLPACQLQGPLPSSLPKRLQHFNIASNFYLRGQLHSSWSALIDLTHLNLRCCQRLTGELNSSWASLTNLAFLDLSSNKLSGELPNNWSKLVRLQRLALGGNTLSGPLPPDWSGLCSLTALELDHNKLSGPLPPAWSNLRKLEVLWLYNNSLSGCLPPSWAELTLLRMLNVKESGLQGPVPEQWSGLQRLQLVGLRDEPLTGDAQQQVQYAGYPLTGLPPFPSTGDDRPVWHISDFVSAALSMVDRLGGQHPHDWVAAVQAQSRRGGVAGRVTGNRAVMAAGYTQVLHRDDVQQPNVHQGSDVLPEVAPDVDVGPESAPGCGCCIA